MCSCRPSNMIRKKPKPIPYNELFGKYRLSYGKPILEGEDAETDDEQLVE